MDVGQTNNVRVTPIAACAGMWRCACWAAAPGECGMSDDYDEMKPDEVTEWFVRLTHPGFRSNEELAKAYMEFISLVKTAVDS
jgi:hypothetical protein